jgi:hypothetical protein
MVKPGMGNGLTVSYFKGSGWKQLPAFGKLTPAKKWNSYEFSVDEKTISPLQEKGNSTFGLVYDGYIQIDKPGEYRFSTQSDDGSKLFINDKAVVNNDGDHGVTEEAGDITLEAGLQKIKVEFFNAAGGYWLDVFYKGPGIPKQLVPANKLFLKKA